VLFDTYGNLAVKPINEETSGIYNLLQELNGKYAEDVRKTGLTAFAVKLDAENKTVENLVRERNDQNAAKTKLKVKACRANTDKVYHEIVERINALIVINGEAEFAGFVDKLNAFIDMYNNLDAQRAGRNKAKKQPAAAPNNN
jgi:hypothetical protein